MRLCCYSNETKKEQLGKSINSQGALFILTLVDDGKHASLRSLGVPEEGVGNQGHNRGENKGKGYDH